MKLLIKNGRVIDPLNNRNGVLDILVEDFHIREVSQSIKAGADIIIDAKDKLVLPGLVDMHVHLREPGREDKETVASGTMAALKGGVTSLLAMPNTCPAMDSCENIKLLKNIIRNSACANVFIAAAITKGRLGKQLSGIAMLKKCGAIAISDDGASVDDQKIFLEALQKAKAAGIAVISHCEDKTLANNGVVNLGFLSTKLGLRGISKESEYKRVERDINLAEKSKTRVHIAHVSCKESVEIIARAKKRRVMVTAETAPHYFSLTEEAVCGYDTNMKVNPPLRTKADLDALKHGLENGTIDAIASDHAPHTENEKDIEFERAEFGAIGLETGLAVSITELVDSGVLDWMDLVRKLSLNPSRILGIDKGSLSVGKAADIIVVDPAKEWVVRKENFISKSKNSAFIGRRLKGVVEWTICKGNIVYKFGA
ncbi:MAG: dihydroorotase [Candidatus Omnitrophota bacterium]